MLSNRSSLAIRSDLPFPQERRANCFVKFVRLIHRGRTDGSNIIIIVCWARHTFGYNISFVPGGRLQNPVVRPLRRHRFCRHRHRRKLFTNELKVFVDVVIAPAVVVLANGRYRSLLPSRTSNSGRRCRELSN